MIIDQLPELTNIFDTDEIPIERGTNTYKTKISTFFSGLRDLIAARVAKSGDTMTGDLTMNTDHDLIMKTNMEVGVAPSAVTANSVIDFRDKNNVQYGLIRGRFGDDGNVGLQLGAFRSGVYHLIAFNIDANGNRSVQITNAAAFLKALGLGSSSGALPITVAQGGSGQSNATSTSTISNIAVSAAGNTTITSASYAQWGKVAMVHLVFTRTVNTGTNTDVLLATIISGKCPKTTSMAVVRYTGANAVGYIESNGSVRINTPTSIPSGTQIIIDATYILE